MLSAVQVTTRSRNAAPTTVPPPTGNRQGEVDGLFLGELFAKFRPDLRFSVTCGLDPRLTPRIARCLPRITHPTGIDRKVRLQSPFESPRKILCEYGESTIRHQYPI